MGEISRRAELPEGGDMRFFTAPDGTKVRYCVWQAREQAGSGTVYLLPGRTEFIEKYAETVHDMLDRGYAVVCMDWRNQGLSDRPLANRSKHYYTEFTPAAADLGQLFQEMLGDQLPRPFILLAHSMGGHLALRYLHDNPGAADKAVFSAPMVDVQTTPFSPGFARGLARSACFLGFGKAYAPMQSDYGSTQRGPQTMKLLTSDPDRFMDEHHWIDRNPDLSLGGITYAWFASALKSIDVLNAPGYAEAITTPTLIVQAGDDPLINNDTQAAFAARLPNGRFERIEGALHEFLKERDEIRNRFLQYFDDFVGA